MKKFLHEIPEVQKGIVKKEKVSQTVGWVSTQNFQFQTK